MIFTDRTIMVKNGTSSINDTIVLYRGDRDVEIRFTLNEGSPFKFGSGASPNIIEKTEAAYGQLIIKRPNDLPAVFSEIAPTNEGKIVFTITAEMIDEITEVGNYTFQIRLLDEGRNSRATLPEVVNGIEIREPIATEDVTTTNEVGEATVGYALTTAGTQEDTFDSQGNYNKTTWGTGDRITAAKLNKIEAGIDGVNKKVASGGTSGEVDLSGYVTKETGNANQITFADGQTFQAKLDAGTLKGEKGDKGADGLTTSISLNGVTYTQENGVITLPNITSGGDTPSVAHIEPEELDMPKVFFYGNALPTTKDNVNLTMDYISNTSKFSSFVKLKCQGNSSMGYAKKNFTVVMYSDEARATKLKKDFKGWGAQSKFCLKANYVDTTHTRNISGARIAHDMVASRPDSTFKQQLLQCPRNGLVDGFPIKLYFNGEFYGIYTWNIPKDTWMFNMDKSNPNHIVLCAEKNTDGNANAINSCQFRQLWTNGDGQDWSVEVGTMSEDLRTKFNRVIAFVMNATDQEFHDNIGEYFDLYSLLDYYCFSYFVNHLDGLAKNMLMVTYDGVVWGASLYDMDSIYGVSWNGGSFVSPQYQCPEQYQEQFSRLWVRIEQCFATELYARYLELRQGALSLSNIVKHVEEIYDVIPDRVFADEKAKWTNLPQVNTNTMTRFRNYMRDRAVYVDAQMREIGTKVPCTGIVLSTDTLSFTTADTQTLSVVVSPTNCTDIVTWSVSPTGIVTVDNGVVTPISNGTCTITATCGSYSDTCNVTVALPSVECTGISLDKNTLALSGASGGSGNINLLSGVNSNIVSRNIEFDAVTLEAGVYEISNINGGTFTWLGYTIDGRKTEPNGSTTNSAIFSIPTTTDVIISAYPNNSATNTADKLALYKCILSNPQQFTQAGNGYFDNSGNVVSSATDVYTETISLDTTKKYAVRYNGSNTITNTCIVVKSSNKRVNNPIPLITGQIIILIENSSTVAVSADRSKCSISDLQLVELKRPQETSLTNKAQLTATVTPTNCTQPVVWSVSPEGVVTVDNGLVTAVANGEATVTVTCGTQSATCAVTVSGMSEGGGDTGDYTDIEYIESTGTQYINTRIVPTTSTKIELVAEMSASKQYDHIFGSDNFMKVQWSDDTGTAIEAVKKNGQNQIFGLTLGKHTYVMDMTETPNVITIDGTKYGNIIGQVESTPYSLLLLCGYKNDGTVETEYCGIGKIYSCKIYYEDTLVANMKPVLTNSGTYGLLDTVNNTFYGSEVGSFTGGGTPSGGDTGINPNLVFKVDSTSMNTADNTLTDNIAGISATLTGNPTVSGNQIVFTANDKFSFDISSLNLTNSNRTIRIKFTPTTLDGNFRCVGTFGNNATSWDTSTSIYMNSLSLRMHHGRTNFNNATVGSNDGGLNVNRIPAGITPTTNTEYEIVISEDITTKEVRWFIDGTLIQNGTAISLHDPLYLGNIEGNNRFIGNYSLIEIYGQYCDTYEDFITISGK